jgi:type IV pilus assembly protein PilB
MIAKIGQILVNRHLIDNEQLDRALQKAAENKGYKRIGDTLIEQLGIPEEAIYRALADQFSMDFVPHPEPLVSMDLLRELPVDIFRDGRCFPLDSTESLIRVVVSDPLDLEIILEVELATNQTVEPVLTTPSEMELVKEKLFEGNSVFKQSAGKIAKEYEKRLSKIDDTLSVDEIRQRTEAEPVVKMVSLIFNEAIKLGASDIHVEPSENNAVIRLRIDGMLKQHSEVSKWMFSPLTSRIKILADLDIAEKRTPQDGRIRHVVDGKMFDFRVSTLPTHHGEKTVIRILKHDKTLLDLSNLGIPKHKLKIFGELIEKPQGMVFVTGPTGSGKSSTLFACLNRIRGKAINITTIENPIEYKLEGINQVQINEKAGVTFASVLRSILRQDPDVILVGEIRDGETAQIAIQASQTGHLVFSTLHTNDALSAITRLRDLGIPGFLIASSLLAIIAQRLVRVLCPNCKYEAPPADEIRQRWNAVMGTIPLPRCYHAAGCDICNDMGYKGRIGIFEVVTVTENIRSMISESATETAIRKAVRAEGAKSLIQDGIEKIEQGITTPEELLRVVLVEDVINMHQSTPEQEQFPL